MKKLFMLFTFFSLLLVTTAFTPHVERTHDSVVQKASYVYICEGSKSIRYHSRTNCPGLNNCKHGIISVSLSDAVNKYGRTPCKICER